MALDDEIAEGSIVRVERQGVLELEAEIVRVCCAICGEEMLGTKREAGGFLAGHEAFHRHEVSLALVADEMGGT